MSGVLDRHWFRLTCYRSVVVTFVSHELVQFIIPSYLYMLGLLVMSLDVGTYML